MCTAAVPQFSNLTLTKVELDEWYDWFYGEDIAGRRPAPSESILLYAERNAWRKIHDLVHGGETLSSALRMIRQDLLFWQREVYERVNKTQSKETFTSMGKGKGNVKSKGKGYQSVWQIQWNKPRKRDGKPMSPSKSSYPPPAKGKNQTGRLIGPSRTPRMLRPQRILLRTAHTAHGDRRLPQVPPALIHTRPPTTYFINFVHYHITYSHIKSANE